MFGISLGEILIILIAALILIKPEEIPDYVRVYKNFLNKFRKLYQTVNSELTEGLNLKDYTEEINEKIKTIIGNDGNKYETYELPQKINQTSKALDNNKNNS